MQARPGILALHSTVMAGMLWKMLRSWFIYARMVLFDITARYNSFEAFLFDYFVAPAVFETMPSFKNKILSSSREGCRILDIGCGGGQLAVDLKKTDERLDVTGLDLSFSQVLRAKTRRMHAGADVHFVQASAIDLPFSDGSFDLVYSVDCLKHWPDKIKGLRECIRVVKPGGMLLITEVDRKCTLGHGLRFVRTWNVPAVLKPFSIFPFFLFAVLRSLSAEEAHALFESLPLRDVTVESGPAGVNWTIEAVKP